MNHHVFKLEFLCPQTYGLHSIRSSYIKPVSGKSNGKRNVRVCFSHGARKTNRSSKKTATKSAWEISPCVIQRQKEKERAFLSFKKVEFLCRQETTLNAMRPSSARARIDDKLPGTTRKGREIGLKRGLLATGNEYMNVLPLYRQKTHIGTGFGSSWRSGISSNPSVMQRKPLTIQGGNRHQARMIVNQETKRQLSPRRENSNKQIRDKENPRSWCWPWITGKNEDKFT